VLVALVVFVLHETGSIGDPAADTPVEPVVPEVTATTLRPTTTAPTTLPAPTTQATTTTTIYRPPAPAPLVAPFDQAKPGEGQWVPVAQANGTDAMWVTSLRPLAHTGRVLATVVVIDQTYLRAGLFNGREQAPGDLQRDDHVTADLVPSLLAAMNGGFKLEHSAGGYVTEGTVVQELVPGRATIGIDREGKITIGELGRDLFDDGSWLTLRQNLILMVDGGQSQVARARALHVYWGAAASWPNFTVFGHAADGAVVASIVDRRMSANGSRYLEQSSKEFFAFFDADLVPAQSVLDV